MIEEIRVRNFLSFKDEGVFSFRASSDSFAEQSQVVVMPNGVRLLRLAVVYGYNASGKSNLLSVISFLRSFVLDNDVDIDDGTGVVPFMLDKDFPSEPSELNIVFWASQKRYAYHLLIDSEEVKQESLLCYETSRPTTVLSRTSVEGNTVIKLNACLGVSKAQKDLLSGNCIKNMSVFAARKKVSGNFGSFDVVREWFKNSLNSVIKPNTKMFNYAIKQIENNRDVKNYLLDFAKKADFNITDIILNTQEKEVPNEFLEQLLKVLPSSDETVEHIKTTGKVDMTEILFSHSVKNERGVEVYKLDDNSQSTGTKRILGLESAIFDIMANPGIVSVDEIEASLHPLLVEKLLFDFLKIEGVQSQLIITTHNDGLLDLNDKLLRKDSFWFTEKQEDGSTDLYQLVDFKGLNRISSIRDAYRLGVFGATLNNR